MLVHRFQHNNKSSYIVQSVYFHFSIDGNLLQNENPKNLGHLVNFVEEYERALRIRDTRDYSNNLENTKIIYAASNRNSSPIGILNWKYAPCKSIDIDYEKQELIPLNSVAFIRNAGFVVKYEKVTPYADNILTRGIFLVDPSHEKDFRSAEPIAHDDWIPARMGLQKGERNPVKKAIEEIRSTFRSANDSQNLNTSGQPLLFVSNVLGAVIGGSPMVGSTSNQNKTKNSRLTPGKLSFSQIDEPYVVNSNNQVYKASFVFQLQKPQKLKTNYNVTIKAKIAIIGGTVESESPALGYQPVITNIGLDENEIFNSLSSKSINSKTINLDSSSLPDTLTVIIECKHGLAVMCLIETQGID